MKAWSIKDVPLGERQIRSEGCTKDLGRYLMRVDLNLAERMHAQLLIADLSKTPPYKTLNSSTLLAYSKNYQQFFAIVNEEDSCDLEPEHFLQAYKRMGGGKDMSHSALPRWTMLHLCAFLSKRGHWVPPALLENSATKTPRPARIPVYISRREIDLVGQDLSELFRDWGGTYSFARQRLNLERHAPLRAAELRYSRPSDYDLDDGLLHITTSGHDHLKNSFSRGSIPLSKEICQDLVDLKDLRQKIDVGFDTLMLADAHIGASYRSFDQVTGAIRKIIIKRTAAHEFRRHDFRAAASTDTCFDVDGEIERIRSGVSVLRNYADWSAKEIHERLIRFAKSARFSRHASTATTLRFYNCSGILDLHQQLEIVTRRLQVGGLYAAAVLDTSAAYLYVVKDRCNADLDTSLQLTRADYSTLVRNALQRRLCQINTPSLQGPTNDAAAPRVPQIRLDPTGAQAIHACLLASTGLSIQTAAGALNLRPEPILDLWASAKRIIAVQGKCPDTKDHAPSLSNHLNPDANTASPLGEPLRLFSRWLASSSHLAKNHGLPLRLALSGNASTLKVVDVDHLKDLFPLLKGISLNGFRVLLRPSFGVLVSSSPGLLQAIETSGIEVHDSRGLANGFGTLQFCVRPSDKPKGGLANQILPKPDDISPRSVGMAGRAVVLGLVIATYLDFHLESKTT